MRVLLVNDYSLVGGAELIVEETQRLLREAGHEAALFTTESAPPHRVTPWRYIDCRRCRRALRARLEAYAPDVVHLHNFYHVLSPGVLKTLRAWRRGRSARVVMTAHDFHLICPNPALRRRSRGRWSPVRPAHEQSALAILATNWDHRGRHYSLLRALQHLWNYRWHDRHRAIDLVLCPSRFMAEALKGADLPVHFLPNPARLTPHTPEKPDGPLRLVFAGRVEPEKGLAPFIRALPRDFDGALEVLGEGSALSTCRAAARERNLSNRVIFAGRVARDEALARIAAAHALVLPSLWLENAPNAMFEALAARTNLLVADHGGMREIVESSGIGFRFDPHDPSSLAAQLEAMERSRRAGTLNTFDAGPFLAERREEAHLAGLLAAYEGAPVTAPAADPVPR